MYTVYTFVAIAVVVVGVFVWKYKKAAVPEKEKYLVTGVQYVGKSTQTVEGVVKLPNPCYELVVFAEVKTAVPEDVLLRFEAKKTAEVCAEVLYEASFHVSFNAGKNARLSATVNGDPAELQLEKRVRKEVDTGEEFTLSYGEEMWVEDMRVRFLNIVDDSRCPANVVCVHAGWVTVELEAGDANNITLRTPGDKGVPNAAVVGSYIITLVEVLTPVSTAGEKIPTENYTVRLRVESYDLKG